MYSSLLSQDAVRRVKFEAMDLGMDVNIGNFGDPVVVADVERGGQAEGQGVEVGDLLIEMNGQAIPTDLPEASLRSTFARMKRPVTLGFYKVRGMNTTYARIEYILSCCSMRVWKRVSSRR